MITKFLLSSVLVFILSAAPVSAQSDQSLEFSGLTITPFLIEAELEPGGVVDQKIVLTNTSSKQVAYDFSINDFLPGENGQVKFLPTGQDAQPKYSLSSWIQITGQPNFNLAPGQSSEVKFQIRPPKDAEPGTHYGGMLFSARNNSTVTSGSITVEKVGAIILAKIGRAKEQGSISSFYQEKNEDGIRNIFLQFHNFGNVHLRPKGEIFIRNTFGSEVGNLYVNRDADVVLPESQKEFISSWHPSQFSFGRYTATAVLYYGNPKIEVRQTISFWILPLRELLIAIALLLLVVFGAKRGINKYNNWLIKKSKG